MELNIFGKPLIPCCSDPMTGYFRDGFCRTISEDTGTHTVCAVVLKHEHNRIMKAIFLKMKLIFSFSNFFIWGY